MELIENWRDGWRMFSVQALAFIAAVQSVLVVLPPDAMQARVPFVDVTWHELAVALTIAAALIGAIGRLVKQSSLHPQHESDPS